MTTPPVFSVENSDVARDLARVDWHDTPLGPPDGWPRSLTTIVRMMLTSRFSMWMAWGSDLTFLCNDAYRRDTLGAKYPWALGRPAREVWAEIWGDIGPRIQSVLTTGVATWDQSLLLFLERSGYREETYHTFSYSPLSGDDGSTNGMLCVVAEETDRVVSERRLATLSELSTALTNAESESSVFAAFETVLAQHDRDLPFVAVYQVTTGDGDGALRLAAGTGRTDPRGSPLAPDALPAPWPVPTARDDEMALVALGPDARWPHGGWDRAPAQAALLPLRAGGERTPSGFFVAGLNPYRPVDDETADFARLVAEQVATALSTARAFDEERQRREALEALDREKTQFFNNVSHEFRTPLTLIMGPVEDMRDALASGMPRDLAVDVDIIHRNGLRLTKLVNTLLDFSRLQAGRMRAAYQPVQLGAFTAELAAAFREAVERAGLELVVELPDDDVVAYVDPEMWEQVVLNLLSNALKFTFSGGITVTVDGNDDSVVLRVADTGIGIAEADLAGVFDRFHRIEHPHARSTEGSGIGLALVSELVALHGGEVTVASELGAGTEFAIAVPRGTAHLPAEQIVDAAAPTNRGDRARYFVSESLGWIEDAADTSEVRDGSERGGDDRVPDAPRDLAEVLVVDDNADMRAYVSRVLDGRFRVRTATNGREALALLDAWVPDLVLSDVMMPEIDGLELVERIRSDDRLAGLPVILLTAQAGSQAELQGLGLGADDYLVKPFSADDLLGRVAARLESGRERRRRLALGQLTRSLASARDTAGALAIVHGFVHAEIGSLDTVLALLDGRGRRFDVSFEPLRPGESSPQRRGQDLETSPLAVAECIRSGEPVLLQGFPDSLDRFPVRGVDARITDRDAALVVPVIRATGEVRGALACLWHGARIFSTDDVVFVRQVAAALNDTLERLAVMEQEHRVLREFQERLLEINLRAPVAVVAARYQPAVDNFMVGGDWYDVITRDDGRVVCSIGDVVGNGLPAAAVMAQLRSALGAATSGAGSPADAVDMVDRYARQVPGAFCATLTSLALSPGRTVEWTRAGHPPPLVLEHDDARFLSEGGGPPLAVPFGNARTTGRVTLAPATLVLLYTDGLVERRGESLDVGLERLRTAAVEHSAVPVGELCDALLDAMRPDDGFRDDVALVAIRVPGHEPERFVDVFTAEPAAIPTARARLRAWLEEHAVSAEECNDLLVAIGEATANAVEHGSRPDGPDVVGVEVTVHDGELVAAVVDSGSWDGEPRPGKRADGGRGYPLMRALMDDVRLTRSRLGTTVVLRRTLGARRATA